SGREGLAMMRKRRPDMLIVGETATTGDGSSTIEQIKSIPMLASMPIIWVSSDGHVDEPQADMVQIAGGGQADANGSKLVSSSILSVLKTGELSPLTLIRCVEALLDNLTPALESAQ